MKTPAFLRVAALIVLTAVAGAAQAILQLPAGTGDDPRSVHYLASGHVVVSNRVDGWQHFVDVTNASNPKLTNSFNPPFGDQWFEAEYTRHHGGRLFTAHRGGGLNMIDVSNPLAPVAVASVPTTYHFRGMRYRPTGTTGALYYNESNSGLKVYDVTSLGTALVGGWNNFGPNNDGNGLELLGNHLYQLGTPAGSSATRTLRAFNVTAPKAPVQCFVQTAAGVATGGHAQLRKIRLPAPAPRIVASRWNDGLELIDTTVPCNPSRTTLFPSKFGPLTITYWGSCPFPNSSLVIVYGSYIINNNQSSRVWFWWPWQIPASGPATPGVPIPVTLDTHDMRFDDISNHLYVVGVNTKSGRGELWVF